MTTFRFLTLASLINIIFTLVNLQTSSSFSPIPKTWASYHQKRSHLVQQLSKEPLEDMFGIANSDLDLKNDATQYFVQGSPEDELSDEMWEDIRTGEPPQWLVLKEILGINGFTYVLAVLIVISLTLNATLGPGWLGQAMGLSGTGTFTEVSKSFPDSVDLSAADYLL